MSELLSGGTAATAPEKVMMDESEAPVPYRTKPTFNINNKIRKKFDLLEGLLDEEKECSGPKSLCDENDDDDDDYHYQLQQRDEEINAMIDEDAWEKLSLEESEVCPSEGCPSVSPAGVGSPSPSRSPSRSRRGVYSEDDYDFVENEEAADSVIPCYKIALMTPSCAPPGSAISSSGSRASRSTSWGSSNSSKSSSSSSSSSCSHRSSDCGKSKVAVNTTDAFRDEREAMDLGKNLTERNIFRKFLHKKLRHEKKVVRKASYKWCSEVPAQMGIEKLK